MPELRREFRKIVKRCVQCGLPKEAHREGGHAFASMDLPEGRTCSDCIHIRFCTQFLGDVSRNTSCDWYPIRFILSCAAPQL